MLGCRLYALGQMSELPNVSIAKREGKGLKYNLKQLSPPLFLVNGPFSFVLLHYQRPVAPIFLLEIPDKGKHSFLHCWWVFFFQTVVGFDLIFVLDVQYNHLVSSSLQSEWLFNLHLMEKEKKIKSGHASPLRWAL